MPEREVLQARKGVRIFIVLGVVLLIVVAIVVTLVLQNNDEAPEDVLEDVMSSYNEKNAENAVNASIFHFAPPGERLEAVVINQQALDHYGYLVSDINVTQSRYLADLNQTTVDQVLEYVNHILTHDYSFLDIVIDDYCILSFSYHMTNLDNQISVNQEAQLLFVEIGGHWFLFGEGLSIAHGEELVAW